MQCKNTLRQIPGKVKIRTIFKRLIFGSHVHCPKCGSRSLRRIKKEDRWRCNNCDLPFSIKSCSWLKGSKLSLEQIWLLLWCWQHKFTPENAMAETELSYPTVFNWYAKFRDKIPRELAESVLLRGQIVGDEMYTKECSIIGAKQKGTRNIAMKVLHQKSVTKTDAINFLVQFTKANSKFFTDGSSIYKGIGNWHRLDHTFEIHKKFEFELTAEIEGLWGVFRTFVRRMYHHVTKYKLVKIVSEFCLRFRQHKMFENPENYLQLTLSFKPFAL